MYFLFIPIGRASTAKGYSQALDGTWAEYKRSTGNCWASRDGIEDSLDFIGWYNHKVSKRTGVSKRDARKLYLAYHDGAEGYNRKTYRKKPWLMKKAKLVQKKALEK